MENVIKIENVNCKKGLILSHILDIVTGQQNRPLVPEIAENVYRRIMEW